MVGGIAFPVVTSIFSSTNETEAYRLTTRSSSQVVLDSTLAIADIVSDYRGTSSEMTRLSEATSRIVNVAEDLRQTRPPDAYLFGHEALLKAADQYALAAQTIKELLFRSDAVPVSQDEAIAVTAEFEKARQLMEQAAEELQRIDETLGLSR